MTISTTTNKAIGLGNGANTNWPFLFIIPDASQLYVYYTDALGNITAIAAGLYSVAGLNNPNGGSVTYPLTGTPIAAGTTLTVYRLVTYQQLTDITNQGGFYPEVYEAALDYLTMEVQQLAELAGRSMVLPLTVSGVSTTLPVPSAGLILGWNATATAIVNLAAAGTITIPVPIAQGGTGQTTAALGFGALAAQSIAYSGVISPAQIVANTNDYNPPNLATASTLRLNTDASRNITSIAGGATGRVLMLDNTGSFPIVLTNDDGATGTAANRFALDIDVTIYGGQSVVLIYDATSSRWRLLAAPHRTSPPVGIGRNLAGRTNAGTPLSQLDFSADEFVLEDTNGNALRLRTVAVTSAITAAGANGLDTGAEAANTTYFHWVIYNPTSRTVAGLISASATAPTMPAGYTYKALASAVRNDAGSNFLPYRQVGGWCWYDTRQQVLTAGAATAETAVSTASFVPSIAQLIELNQKVVVQANAGLGTDTVALTTISGTTQHDIQATGAAAGQFATAGCDVILPNIGQNVYYKNTQAGSVISANCDLYVMGYKLPIGGE